MNVFDIILTGVGLSMDAFAIALSKGLSMGRFRPRESAVIGLFFGAAQALMPLLGYFLGSRFASYIQKVDYLVAFSLLAFIGGKMIWDTLRGEEQKKEGRVEKAMDIKELFVLAVATSIDALAVGVAFSFQEVNILPAALIIGLTTFLISFFGAAMGSRFGQRLEKKAPLLGGAVLILIGVKIVLNHFGILAF